MTLIKSISGIRGTIGGKVGENLTPVDAIKFASAYGTFLKNSQPSTRNFPTRNSQKLRVLLS
jgi:phosphomannomutase